jgi:hypothetical protein
MPKRSRKAKVSYRWWVLETIRLGIKEIKEVGKLSQRIST